MKNLLLLASCIGCLLLWGCQSDEPDPVTPSAPTASVNPVAVTKSNDTKLYMHYMPWFHSMDFSGYWGIHWRMANRNPDNILANGNREIAAHYYPLIGPYDSSDPDVIEYHLLLMKYAGIDGLLIDWYGSHDVSDYGTNLENTNNLVDGIKRVGLDFAMVYEEFTANEVANQTDRTDIEAAQADMSYAAQNYFSSNRYIYLDGAPLLLTFGPRHFQSPVQWGQILGVSGPTTFMPLWNATSQVGETNADGEFSWG